MTVEAQKETHGFQAEVNQLLKLMINSLYSNKEIVIRELISNASDACDKLRFEAMNNSGLFEDNAELKIWIDFDKDAKTIKIRDNGIGMSRDEVISHLGTIAKSGTKEFLENLTGDKAKDSQLIGQFGVGFYSSFIIADNVQVNTRRAGLKPSEGVCWTSKGDGKYTVEDIEKQDRGTTITLFLKEGEEEFLNGWMLRNLIKKYSDHISLPVVMNKDPEFKDSDDKENDEVIVPEEEIVNSATAIWTKPKSEIEDEQYQELYKYIAHDFDDPLIWSHNKVEGKHEYTSVLFIPSRAPFDLYHMAKPHGLKLYVKRVFIMDDAEQFLPNYLRFVRGIIDSSDLPLNVSREILQGNRITDSIRTAIIKRVLGMLESMATDDKDKYKKFWKEFGQVMKEGPAEDFSNREKIASLLRFSTTNDSLETQEISLDDYISRMKEGQDKIYYVTAETFNAAKNSPHLEIFNKKGIEVLLLTDRVDEWLMSHLMEYKDKKFVSVARGDLEIGDKDEQEASTEQKGEFENTITKIKEILGDKVKDVRLTKRLTDSPACIITDANDMSLQMERMMRAAGQNVPESKPILELNPEHLIVKSLKNESNEGRFKDWSLILFDQAILAEGGHLSDPASFVKRFNSMMLDVAAK